MSGNTLRIYVPYEHRSFYDSGLEKAVKDELGKIDESLSDVTVVTEFHEAYENVRFCICLASAGMEYPKTPENLAIAFLNVITVFGIARPEGENFGVKVFVYAEQSGGGNTLLHTLTSTPSH